MILQYDLTIDLTLPSYNMILQYDLTICSFW